ncbi:putative uncharacterized protein [Bacteroides sp. CAG:144]|nr:putative uncharacterized protein [Bacteroides sp. CAG:144]
MSKIGFWIKNARHISLPQSLLPGFLAIGMSLDYGSFSWGLSLVALCGVACAHLGMNLLDDYYDYRRGIGRYVAGSLSLRACFVADSGFFVAFTSPFCRRTPRRNRS